MKIILLSPIYASTTGKDASTPVVHYFAKEWVKQGHEVTVFHLDPKYPSFLYYISKRFQHQLVSLLNFSVPVDIPKDYHTTMDGVDVYGVTYTKYIPHSRIGNRQKCFIINIISDVVKEKGTPDIFIGHWEIPQLDLLPLLKQKFKRPTCLVFHSNDFMLEKKFGKDLDLLLKQIDIIGFRNRTALVNFSKRYTLIQKSFIAHSGVSSEFLQNGEDLQICFEKRVSKFVYVGLLIERKQPALILEVLEHVYNEDNFEMKYIGDGTCKEEIIKIHQDFDCKGELIFTGRLKRYDVISQLKESQVFIMVSKGEVFGLVYLEAMALGLIPIGSRGEGIDGIIVDGVNGFLCDPNDKQELEAILSRLKNMSPNELQLLSNNARKTAIEYSDYNVAKNYIDNLIC